MSDTTPHDAAILILRERERELDGEIQGHQRALELASARREELLDLIATLSRKPRQRRARSAECTPARTISDAEASVDGAIRSVMFGAPSGGIVEAA